MGQPCKIFLTLSAPSYGCRNLSLKCNSVFLKQYNISYVTMFGSKWVNVMYSSTDAL
jgi:hypothetical protein